MLGGWQIARWCQRCRVCEILARYARINPESNLECLMIKMLKYSNRK